MKSIKTFIKIFIGISLLLSFSYAKQSIYKDSLEVSRALGYAISHKPYRGKSSLQIDIHMVREKLDSYIKEGMFVLSSAFVTFREKSKKSLYIEGYMIHFDDINRAVNTIFRANCSIKNRHLIVINSVELKNISKPRGLFFIVPSERLDINRLKNMRFYQAVKEVDRVSRRLASFNLEPDFKARKYKLVTFIMNKIDSPDKVYGVFSDRAFDAKGKAARIIKTKDNWYILAMEAKFAYNSDIANYFNLLWQKDDYLIALESYSTQGLIKSIQLALIQRGYDVGILDGKLNPKTQKAIQEYLKKSGFYVKSKISESLLWFIKQYDMKNISKVVQLTLLGNGINVGRVDGHIGPMTIRGIKRYQREFHLRVDGKITPELVKFMIETSNSNDIYTHIKKLFGKPLYVKRYYNKMLPNAMF